MDPRLKTRHYGSFDYETTLDRVDGDWEFLLELVDLFLQDNPRLMRSLSEAVARNDRQAVAMVAHTLKGAASNFDAREVVRRAQHLQLLARDDPEASLEQPWRDLENAVRALREDMTRFLEQSRSETPR